MNNFIREYKIPLKICDDIIKYFKKNKKLHVPGKIFNSEIGYGEVNYRAKVSTDMGVKVKSGIKIFDKYNSFLIKCIHKYVEEFPEMHDLDSFGLTEGYNVQYYKKNEGFKLWHSERGSSTSKRMLVFMTYLNDVPDGGTHFKNYDLTVKAKKGSTVIWPSDFTHTHKSQISKKYSKYIVTGWINFIEN
jgi:prolyl 4-hydroxylase